MEKKKQHVTTGGIKKIQKREGKVMNSLYDWRIWEHNSVDMTNHLEYLQIRYL